MIPISIGRKPSANDLVGELLECHQRIRTFTRLALDLGTRADLPDSEVTEACTRVERYFVEALPRHVDDEEQSLLPRLRGLQSDVDAALVTMEQQHKEHEPVLQSLLEATRALRESPQDRAHRDRLAASAKHLTTEFEVHLQLEETVIFPFVKSQLSSAAQAEVMSEMRARRSKR